MYDKNKDFSNKKSQQPHPPQSLTATAKLSTTGDNDAAFYLDSTASVSHMTYHSKDHICPDLNDQQTDVQIANGRTLQTQKAETIAHEVMDTPITS